MIWKDILPQISLLMVIAHLRAYYKNTGELREGLFNFLAATSV